GSVAAPGRGWRPVVACHYYGRGTVGATSSPLPGHRMVLVRNDACSLSWPHPSGCASYGRSLCLPAARRFVSEDRVGWGGYNVALASPAHRAGNNERLSSLRLPRCVVAATALLAGQHYSLCARRAGGAEQFHCSQQPGVGVALGRQM